MQSRVANDKQQRRRFSVEQQAMRRLKRGGPGEERWPRPTSQPKFHQWLAARFFSRQTEVNPTPND